MLSKIEHVALAVSDLEAAIELYSKVWGMDLEHREVIPEQGVEEATLRIGDSYIQLLKPLSPDSIIGKFIERRGEGLHHIAYEVDDLKSELDRLKQEGAHLIDEEPKAGSRGRNIAFVHPKANRGLLVELVEREGGSEKA